MKPVFKFIPIFALCAGSIATGPIGAANCLDNRDYYQNLPSVIGREDQVGKYPFALKCDTVYVRKGVTTTVYPGTMLYFAQPSLGSVIKVEGALILKGTKNSYVTLSGSLDSSRNGLETGRRQWGGIEVAEGGRLETEFAGFMRAPTPITAFSPQVKIVNSWFKGSSGMILPDGSLYAMETTWHAINNLDLSKGYTDAKPEARPPEAISEKEKAALLKKEPGFWTWKTAGIGVAALAAAGAGIYLLVPEKSPSTKPTDPPGPQTRSGLEEIETLPLPSP